MDNNHVIMRGKELTRVFGYGKKAVIAVNKISFSFHEKEVISLVGESGSGKTTLAKMLLGLLKPTVGTIYYKGSEIDFSSYKIRKSYWKEVQAIFQDPFSSFNQFYKVEKVLNDCVKFLGLNPQQEERQEIMRKACNFVNLEYNEIYNKYPFELSGGQMQRLMIARVFILNPIVLIADEPTSMIDACSRSTIMDMLFKLREEIGMTIIFITHDIGLAYYISDTIYIMQKGEIVENKPAKDIIANPEHPYTQKLLEDVPKLHEKWL
jgi:peptide/nickel transport system ATP-binding protein